MLRHVIFYLTIFYLTVFVIIKLIFVSTKHKTTFDDSVAMMGVVGMGVGIALGGILLVPVVAPFFAFAARGLFGTSIRGRINVMSGIVMLCGQIIGGLAGAAIGCGIAILSNKT